VDRSKNEKTVDAHTMHTEPLKSTARSSQPKGTDMRGIQKITNKDCTKSYRAQVRLNDGLPPQSKSFPTLVEARTWKAQEEAKRRQGMYFPSMTSKQNKLDALIDRYIVKVLPSKPKNARNTQHLLLWWKTKLGNLSLNKLSSDVISKTRDILLDNPKKDGKSLSPRTVNRYLASLSTALTYGVEECGWLHVNPCLNVSKFNEGPSRNRLLTPEEMDRFLDACRKSKSKALYPMIFLAMRSGMRLGELQKLDWRDVNLNQNVLFLRDTKNGTPRSVPLSDDAKAIIETIAPIQDRKGLVFKSKHVGGKLSIYKAFYNALSVAGISDLHIHDFRHFFCTTAAQSGASILQIKAITGHKTLQQLSGYTHIEGAHLKHIVDSVDKALSSEASCTTKN
jgi:integrase